MSTQEQDKYVLRLPDGLRDEIKDAAKANGRSMNAEIVARLTSADQQRTLRDAVAIAVVSAIAGQDSLLKAAEKSGAIERFPEIVARSAFRIADAFLAERAKGGDA